MPIKITSPSKKQDGLIKPRLTILIPVSGFQFEAKITMWRAFVEMRRGGAFGFLNADLECAVVHITKDFVFDSDKSKHL